MNRHTAHEGGPSGNEGARTGAKGTAFAVSMSGESRAWATIAVFVAGPVIWSVHFMVVYLVVEAGCTGDGPGLAVFDPPVPTVATFVATIVAVLACVASAAWGYRRWRADRREGAGGEGLEPPDPGGSLAFGGFLLSLLGIVEILFVGLPALVLGAC